jgi:hypothetical protein
VGWQASGTDMNIHMSSNAAINSKTSCMDPNVRFHFVSNIAMQEDMNCGELVMAAKNNRSKLSTTVLEGREDKMAIPAPTTSASKSINPIHIQFGTFDFDLEREDEINMVSIVSCLIKIKGINFTKSMDGPLCQSRG